MIHQMPLTDLQKGILFEISQFKGRNYYLNQELLCFSTSLDLPLLKKAFIQLIAKYEVLRSAIVFDSCHPTFVVYEDIDLPLKFYDHTGFDDAKKEEFFAEFIDEELERFYKLPRHYNLKNGALQLT